MKTRLMLLLAVMCWSAVGLAADVHLYMVSQMNGSVTMSDGTVIAAWGFRQGSGMAGSPQVPGPILRANEGDNVFVHFTNYSSMPHTIHLHGLDVDQANDGVPQTSFSVPMMGSYTYQFVAPHAGSYSYHCHVDTILHLQMGMYGAINILPPDGSNHAWAGGPAFNLERTWVTGEVDLTWNQQQGATDFTVYTPSYFLVNGHDGPLVAADPYTAFGLVGNETALVRLGNMGYLPVRYDFGALWTDVVASDGRPLPQSYQANGLLVAPGERYDVMVRATSVGVTNVTLSYLDLYDGAVLGTAVVPVTASGTISGVGDPFAGVLDVSTGYPSPFNSEVSFALNMAEPGEVTIDVFDVRGRRVKSVRTNASEGAVFAWDGRDDAGRKAAEGVYHVQFRHGQAVVTRKVVYIR